MTIEEFSNEFDVLLNSFSVVQGQPSLVLDEYEKSVLLTKAQEEIVKSYYTGSFEGTEEMRRGLEGLVVSDTPTEKTDVAAKDKISSTSQVFVLPSEVWFITYEAATLTDDALGCKNNTEVEVTPVRQDEYHRVKNNPFRGPTSDRVLRIDTGSSCVELISKYKISNYFIKYVKEPSPIILEDITNDNLSINNNKITQTCKLNTALHRPILERAVALAIQRVATSK